MNILHIHICSTVKCITCTQGLEVGDEVIQFGSISAANFVNMQSVATIVEHSKGVSYVACIGCLNYQFFFYQDSNFSLNIEKLCMYVLSLNTCQISL